MIQNYTCAERMTQRFKVTSYTQRIQDCKIKKNTFSFGLFFVILTLAQTLFGLKLLRKRFLCTNYFIVQFYLKKYETLF